MFITKSIIHNSTISPLLGNTQYELNDVFDTLSVPLKGELDGCYRGCLMGIIGTNWLNRLTRIYIHRLLQTVINPWAGKWFDGINGANYWFTQSGKIRWGHYLVEDDIQGQDALPVTLLSYDVEKNMGMLRSIRGEVRKLNEGLFLARMHYVTKHKIIRVLYFTLEKVQSSE